MFRVVELAKCLAFAVDVLDPYNLLLSRTSIVPLILVVKAPRGVDVVKVVAIVEMVTFSFAAPNKLLELWPFSEQGGRRATWLPFSSHLKFLFLSSYHYKHYFFLKPRYSSYR